MAALLVERRPGRPCKGEDQLLPLYRSGGRAAATGVRRQHLRKACGEGDGFLPGAGRAGAGYAGRSGRRADLWAEWLFLPDFVCEIKKAPGAAEKAVPGLFICLICRTDGAHP